MFIVRLARGFVLTWAKLSLFLRKPRACGRKSAAVGRISVAAPVARASAPVAAGALRGFISSRTHGFLPAARSIAPAVRASGMASSRLRRRMRALVALHAAGGRVCGFHGFVVRNEASPRSDDLGAVEDACGQEIEHRLRPQAVPFEADLRQGGAHAVDADVAVDAERRGEEVGHGLPERGHGRTRPRDAGDEQQRHRGENDEQDARLAPAHGHRDRHGEKDGGQQEGDGEGSQRGGRAEMVEPEQARDDAQHVDGNRHVDEQVGQPLAEDDAEQAVEVAVDGHELGIAVVFARRAGRKADAEEERLVDDKHEDGRDEECRKAVLRVVEAHLLVGDGLGQDFLLFLGQARLVVHLDVGVHVERDVGVRGQEGFIVEQAAHVAEHLDAGLAAAHELVVEVLGQVDNAVGLAAAHHLARLVHVGAPGGDMDVGRGVEVTHVEAAAAGPAVVDDGHGDVAHHFVRIDEGVDERIGQGDEQEEDEITRGIVEEYQYLRNKFTKNEKEKEPETDTD